MSDKRQVATDALATIGTIISESEARDAIHLAVEPVIAAETIEPGKPVRLAFDGRAVRTYWHSDGIGIVDPFLKEPVKPGERFWLVLYPGQVTSLRHVWTHPKLDASNQKLASAITGAAASPEVSKAWLEAYADSIDVTYRALMRHAEEWLRHEEYWIGGAEFEALYFPSDFWVHYETVTGEKVPEDRRQEFISCSC